MWVGGADTPHRPHHQDRALPGKCFLRREAGLALFRQDCGQEGKGCFSSLSKKSEMKGRRHGSNYLIFYGWGRGKLRQEGLPRVPQWISVCTSARPARDTAPCSCLVPPQEPALGVRWPEGEKGPPAREEQVSGLFWLPQSPASPQLSRSCR